MRHEKSGGELTQAVVVMVAAVVGVAALLGRPRLGARFRLGGLARPPSLAVAVGATTAGRGGARGARIRRVRIDTQTEGVQDGLGKGDAAGLYGGRTRAVASGNIAVFPPPFVNGAVLTGCIDWLWHVCDANGNNNADVRDGWVVERARRGGDVVPCSLGSLLVE